MSYRIYLQIPNGSAFERTETGSHMIAESVFKALLERGELDKTEVSVHLLYQRTVLAIHRFDVAQGTPKNWQGWGDKIAWPAGQGQVGQTTELKGGGPTQRVSEYSEHSPRKAARKRQCQ